MKTRVGYYRHYKPFEQEFNSEKEALEFVDEMENEVGAYITFVKNEDEKLWVQRIKDTLSETNIYWIDMYGIEEVDLDRNGIRTKSGRTIWSREDSG